ncbi:hypothetical protein ABT112_01110 [Streptomyces sp. NPDC002055]|uniref:hypothetical protein n=1 Tax=Streptomyces sp. NPDC002055 TaxID=3154534 RepID=UPI00331EF47F
MTDPEKWSWPVFSPLHSGPAQPPVIRAVSRSDRVMTARGFRFGYEVTVRRCFSMRHAVKSGSPAAAEL